MKVNIQLELDDEKFAGDEWFAWLNEFNNLGLVKGVYFMKEGFSK